MTRRAPRALRTLILATTLALAGCAIQPVAVDVVAPKAGEFTVLKARAIDPALEERILALDPERVSGRDVAEVLSKGPAPQIMLVHGGIFPVHLAMTSFGVFLSEMGYPDAKIREPRWGEWSYTPYSSTARLAGILAWHYEQDGMRPMIVGHSQGGLYTVKILKELAGVYTPTVAVWDPIADRAEPRTTVVDPLTAKERPVVGLSASYASALGAGGWALVLPNQWDDFASLRRIPDTVEEFTGYFIELDLFALSFPGNPLDVPYVGNGRANVRNVTLPAAYNHVFVPVTHELAANPQVRAWLNDYVPGRTPEPSDAVEATVGALLWAADVWHSIKKAWVLEGQRLIRARRAALGGAAKAGG
ncbi:hypothetical protein BURK1_00722 [Burkholderiales bacterium]|nr:hypothetical protein BURK1_00722 [Burkholderiales bacterium]